MVLVDIEKKLETFAHLIQDLGVNIFNSREIWNRQKEIVENFKAAQFETAEAKANAIAVFDKLTNDLKEKEAAIEASNIQFTQEAELAVQKLAQAANDALSKPCDDKEVFKNLKDNCNKVFEYFKQQKWSGKEKRTMAWDIYSNTRNFIKEKEDELYAKEKESRSKLVAQSAAITEKLCVIAAACNPASDILQAKEYVQKFALFAQENEFNGNEVQWYLNNNDNDTKYSLKCRTETINNIRNFVTLYKDHLTREHKNQIFKEIDDVKVYLNQAWEMHKADQQQKQAEWEEKRKERDSKRAEWLQKQQDFLAVLVKRLENQKEYKEKQEDYLQSQAQFGERFRTRIVQQKDFIKKLTEQIEDLRQKAETAWTVDFKEKTEGWIEEKKEKIASVEKDIEVLAAKVEDIDKNVLRINKKLDELNDSIKEIETKAAEVKEKIENDKFTVEAKKITDEQPAVAQQEPQPLTQQENNNETSDTIVEAQ